MYGLLWLVPALPFAGFLTLALLSRRFPRKATAAVGVGSVALSAIVALLIGVNFLASPPPDHVYVESFWTWIQVGDFTPNVAFHLDALSLVMMLVITFVGFLIHLYSSEFMIEEAGYARFFAYMNLFVGSMLTLVLADNLLLLYLGWEGVGLCSYLLIGFWYQDPANGRAARKAFIVTRIGDTAMAIGLFLLFDNLGTLQIQDLMQRATQQWAVGSSLAVAAAALLLGGAVGKSAQLPLQIWLPDAMAGPTPVSALIHAATMVTAGVYLVARTNALFALAPAVQLAVAVIGALTLLLAGFSALTQRDIKRVLAYSTMSQIGYMFLALGVGAWSAAIFHFMTHAFFKALLFLAAGVLILRLHHEHNMFKMGGLRKELPLVFGTFLIGACSLAALPLVTAGFYSKDLILWAAWAAPGGSPWLWAAGALGALLTALYTFRMVFLTFFGQPGDLVREATPIPKAGAAMRAPLVILAALSIVGGFLQLPDTLGGLPLFADFLHTILPALQVVRGNLNTELVLQLVAAAASLGGIYAAYLLFMRRRQVTERIAKTPLGQVLHRFWFVGWGFDWLDNEFIVRPFVWLAKIDKNDVVDLFYRGLARLAWALNRLLSLTQTGQVRRYALGIAIGAAIVTGMVVLV
jgi:NADH-quinone oxidoreductase subunit L